MSCCAPVDPVFCVEHVLTSTTDTLSGNFETVGTEYRLRLRSAARYCVQITAPLTVSTNDTQGFHNLQLRINVHKVGTGASFDKQYSLVSLDVLNDNDTPVTLAAVVSLGYGEYDVSVEVEGDTDSGVSSVVYGHLYMQAVVSRFFE